MTRSRVLFILLALAVALGATTSAYGAKKPKPNLKASGVALVGGLMPGGQVLSASYTISSGAAASAPKSKTYFYLSTDRKQSKEDKKLATIGQEAKLGKGRRKSHTATQISIGSSEAIGRYLIVCADGPKKIVESKESDNCAASPATITATTAGGTQTVPTPVVPDPTGPTGPPPADADADGEPDTTDCAPSDSRLPGADHPHAPSCVGQIYDASNGNGVDGSVVALSNVLVSAVGSGGHIYVQIKPGDIGYSGIYGPKYSGLEVSQGYGRQVGERVNIYGTLSSTSTGWLLAAQNIAVVGSNEATTPATVSYTEFLSDGPAFDGVLLSLPSDTIASIDGSGWLLTGTSIIVTPTLIGALPAASAGQNISSLKAIGESFDSNFKLMPRSSDDLVLDPLSCSLLTADSLTPPHSDCS